MEHTYTVELNYQQYLILQEILERFEKAIEKDREWQEKCCKEEMGEMIGITEA